MKTQQKIILLGALFITFLIACKPGGEALDYVGEFKGNEIALTLEQSDDSFLGRLQQGENTFPVDASLEGGELSGYFSVSDKKYAFSASLSGTVLTLSSDGNVYTLEKEVSSNPLGAGALGGNPLGGNKKNTTSSTNKSLTSYSVNDNITFDYPSSWSISEADEISLIPDGSLDPQTGEYNIEVTVGFFPFTGISSPFDDSIVTQFDTIMSSQGDFYRQGSPVTVATQMGKGAMVKYSGTHSEGINGDIGVYTLYQNGHIMYVVHSATTDKYSQHVMDVKQLFSSIRGQGGQNTSPDNASSKKVQQVVGKLNEALFGTWFRRTMSGSGVFMESTIKFSFGSDGRVAYGSGSFISGGSGSVSVQSGGGGSVDYGNWHVEGKQIIVNWDDETNSTYPYSIFAYDETAKGLALTYGGSEKYFKYIN